MNCIQEITNFNLYDGTELSIVVEFTLPDGSRACEALATIDLAEVDLALFPDPVVFYSVYLHLKTGGVDVAADFDTLEKAQVYCHALDTIFNF